MAVLLLVISAGSSAQVVRVNEAPEGYHVQVTTNGVTAWFAYSATLSCAPVYGLNVRQVALDGQFLTPESYPYPTCGEQSNALDLAMLPDGRFLLVRERGSSLFASRFDAAGNLIGTDLDLHGSAISDCEPRVIATEADRWTVVWGDKQAGVAWARQVDSAGAMGTKLPVDPGSLCALVRVGQLGSGEIVIAWNRRLPSGNYEVVTRGYDLALTPVAPELIVSQTPAIGTDQLGLGAAADRYVVAWDNIGYPTRIYLRVRFVDAATGPIGNEVEPNDAGVLRPYGPIVAMDGSGRSLIVWHQIVGGQLWGRWYDAQAQPLSGPFPVIPSPWEAGWLPDMAMFPGGDVLVAYMSAQFRVVFNRFFYPLSLAVGPGPGPGNVAEVRIHRPDGRPGPAFRPFASQSLGANVIAGQIDGDAGAEVLAGPGPSTAFGPHVRGFQPDATAIAKVSFYAYGTLRYGVKPGAGDLDGDGFEEIVTTPGPGAVFGPHVRGFDYDGASVQAMSKVSFFAFSTLKYGANAATPALDGDGYEELLAAPGPGAAFGAQVKGFDYDNASVRAIAKVNAYAFPSSTHGATVSASDVESDGIGGFGDGFDELLVGRGPALGSDAELRLFDYDATALSQKYALTTAYTTLYGIESGGGDADAGDTGEVVTAPGPDPAAPARVRTWEWKNALPYDPLGSELIPLGSDDFVTFPGYAYGAHVAVGRLE